MQWPGGRILQRHELDAFLAQAVSNQLYEPDQLQELKVMHFLLTLSLSDHPLQQLGLAFFILFRCACIRAAQFGE